MQKIFYVTTPIYYPNGVPHIGTAYTSIAADILTRWHRLKNGQAFLLTGMDEHGQKIEQASKAKNIEPKDYVEKISAIFKEAWKQLDIHYDDFIRTTEKRHVETVLEIFKILKKQGDIYKNFYEGWYCVSCETFWLESQLVEKKCPNVECQRPVEWLKEEDYFFKLTKFQDLLLKHYETHPDFVSPQSRFNEVISFVSRGLQDVCVSRKGLTWGIPVPEDPERSIYVWIDALDNYITAIGYLRNSKQFESLWPADVHLVGKDILRFHAVIWPAILMALKLPLPKKIFANGWLTIQGCKISKSRGGHRNLLELLELYGADPIRYFLMREGSFGLDIDFSEEGIVRRLNTDLANDFGNLVQRTLSMVHRYREGKVPQPHALEKIDLDLKTSLEKLPEEMDLNITQLRYREALESLFTRVVLANKYVDEVAPWKIKDENRLSTILYSLLELVRILALALASFLPKSAEAIWKQLGLRGSVHDQPFSAFQHGSLKPGDSIGTPTPLFRKVEIHAH